MRGHSCALSPVQAPAPIRRRLSLHVAFLLAAGIAHDATAQTSSRILTEALTGRWTFDPGGSCAQAFRFELAGDTLRVVAPDGSVDVQRVIQRRETGIATETTTSTHDVKKGAKRIYEILAPGQLSMTMPAGQSGSLQRCHDPIPAGATAAEFLRGLFDVYVAEADASLPFASDAGLRAFLVPDLADQFSRYFDRLRAGGRIDRVCVSAEPITGAQDDYKVRDVQVVVDDPAPASPDRASGTVSFSNMDTPASVRFDLRRTPAGWRIDDLRAGTGPSLRTQIAPCATEAAGR